MNTLHEVSGWQEKMTCVPTALSAITGVSFESVVRALQEAVSERGGGDIGEYPRDLGRSDCTGALERLGFEHMELESYMCREQQGRPRVWQIMKKAERDWVDTLILIFSDDQTEQHGHVFAAKGGSFVDVPTRGRVVQYYHAQGYVSHRAKFVLKVSKRADGG